MAIQKTYLTPNGVSTLYHKILKIDLVGNDPEISVQVASWPTEEAALIGSAAVWNTYIRLPAEDLYDTIQSKILQQPEFQGGTVLLEPTTLEKIKQRKWLELKAYRDAVEAAGFIWDGSTFDSDTQSQSRIQGAVQLAIIAQQNNQPFSIDWTLQNNTVRTLSGADMVAVGMTLASFVQNLHQTGRVLRTQVEACTTIEQVEAIQWPV